MSRVCQVTGKKPMTGHNVSHANNKTRRRFLPNLRTRRLFSELLGQPIRVRIATSTLRSVEKNGGIDGYLLKTAEVELPGDLVRLKRRIAEAQQKRSA